MKKFVFALCCAFLLTLTAAFAEDSLGGAPTNTAEINYAFAWSAERDEQSAPLGDRADLHLTMLKNEWESFFLQVKTAAPDQAVTVEITPFTNANGDSFAASVYEVGYAAGEDGSSYPQTLNAVDGAPVALTSGLTTSFLVETYTDREQVTGDYSATLTMKAADGSLLLEKEVTVTVYQFWLPKIAFVESSVGKTGKLPKTTAAKPMSFLGYKGNSYDYFRIALEFLGEDWLNEHFDNIVAELDAHRDDVDFFVEARAKLAKIFSGDLYDFREPAATLHFGEDGKFTVLVLADLHAGWEGDFNEQQEQFFRAVIEQENPDLIVLTGDNVHSEMRSYITVGDHIHSFMPVFEEYGVPVAMVFGNHETDDRAYEEGYGSPYVPKTLQMATYQTYDNFMGVVGEAMTGVGNYYLPIQSSDGTKMAFNLWFIDSGAYATPNPDDGYACVAVDQIEWYVETSNALKAQNGGQPVPSINFQHIIVPEIYDALVQTDNGIGWALPEDASGVLGEIPGSPKFTNGQFAAFVQQGDVIATVHGHEHINSFVVPYQGVDIINTPICTTNAYHDGNLGIRVIELNESDLWNYATWIVKPADVGLSLE